MREEINKRYSRGPRARNMCEAEEEDDDNEEEICFSYLSIKGTVKALLMVYVRRQNMRLSSEGNLVYVLH